MRPFITPVARGVPFDNTGLNYTSADVQAALAELLASKVWDQASTATTLNGTLTLTSASKALQFITGTQTGYSVQLPDATTLFLSSYFKIANTSSQPITIKDGAGTTLVSLVSNSIGFFHLQAAGSAAGTWMYYQSAIADQSASVTNYNISSTTAFTTSSTTDAVITGFTLTPAAGTYACFHNATMTQTNSAALNWWSFYKAASQVTDSERNQKSPASAATMFQSTQTVIQVNGSQAVDVRVRTNTGSITINGRNMILIRLGP